MATTPRKTFPELQALSAPLVDSDVVAVYRAPGPAKRTTASVFSDYIKAFFSASGGSALIGFLQAGTGAVTRTVQARLRDTVSAFDFIPVAEHAAIVAGTSTYNATSAIQAAINTGKTVEFPAGDYQAVGLTMSTDRQRLVALGDVKIIKNGNGVILSSSANNIELNGIAFRGESATPAFTGHNISLTGNGPRLINCGSRYAFARALKSTGNNLQLYGTCDIYQTSDATATGYDIEVGVSGTASLYHEIHGYYSSQSTGGILFVDCGSQTIVGGEFGKLNISSGTSPAGVNGGKCVGARVLGNVTVGISNAVFTGNQFSNITFTIAAGTSGTTYVGNLEASGFSMVNNGTVNQFLLRHDTAGAGGYITYMFGPSSSLAKLQVDPASGDWVVPNGNVQLNAEKVFQFGTNNKRFGSSSTNLQLTNTDGALQFTGANLIQNIIGSTIYSFDADSLNLPAGTVIELGDASDTTIARASAGNISVEGNLVYRAGGTDVPVTDGGTGASTAAAALTNLGASPSFGTVLTSAADSTALNAAAQGTLLSAGTYNLASDVAGLGKAFFAFGAVKFTGAGVLQTSTQYGVGALANNVGFNTSTPTLTDKNSAFGTRALYNNTTGYHNSAFGDEALRACTTGTQNSAFGIDSQLYLTSGADNSAFGVSSLRDNVTGTANSAFGRACLFGVLGSNNVGMGRNVAYQATTVDKLVAVGSEAFWSLTTGDENVGIGYRAQYLQTTGAQNVAVGSEAGYSGVTNSFTAFFGHRAGFANTVNDVSGFGYLALGANTTGARGSAFGMSALAANTTGADNVAFGWRALQANTTGDENTAVGSQALVAATSLYNTAVGASALAQVTTGNTNTAIGRQAGSGLIDGNGNTYIGYNAAAGTSSETNSIRISSGSGTTRYYFGGTNHELVGGYTTVGALRVGANQVVGAQGAAVADATDAASVIARLNDLLARLRTHGLIAT